MVFNWSTWIHFLVYIYVDVQGLIFTSEHVLLLIANYIVVEGFLRDSKLVYSGLTSNL